MKSYVRYFVLLIFSPFRWFLYYLSGFVPKSEKVWLFGSWDGYRFSDNSKWFYIHCNQNNYPENLIWITRDKKLVSSLNEIGYKAHYFISLKGLWYCLRAKFYFIDHTSQDINFFTSRNSIIVNQFHGIPLKKLRRDIPNRENFNFKVFHGKWYYKFFVFVTRPYIYEEMDYFAVTSPENKRIFSRAFKLPPENLHVIGHTRNDSFLNKKLKLNSIDRDVFESIKEKKLGVDKLIMYLPTWRDHDRKRTDPINWSELNNFLRENNSLFIPKLHSYDKLNLSDKEDFSNIYFLHHSVDIYPLLEITDILVTDYSSIYFDFLLTGKPVVFYCYDLDEYVSKSRSFYYDYDQVTPGDKANNFDQLMKSLELVINDEENYQSKWKAKYEYVLDLSFTYKDGNSGKRLYDDIKNHFQI